MNNDYTSSNFKKLLDKLQTESWQLELLISGFAIFGLFQALNPLKRELTNAIGNSEEIYLYFLSTVSPAINILLIVLLIHVILRGLWIGSIGLRYVSGDIDYEHLNYSDKFTDYLKKRIVSFDRYISRLENICSMLFAIAFLMAFYFIAFMLIFLFFILATNLVEATGIFNREQQLQFQIYFGLIYFSCVFLVFVDFIGMGVLKKGKLRPKIYYPIYRFFSIITLSFLYRPLVYNFLDQNRVKWLATFILPTYLIGSLLVGSFTKKPSNYLSKNSDSSSVYANSRNYEDILDENEELVDFAVIPSKVITTSYLPLKIPFTDFKENAVFEQDSLLKPSEDKRGYGFNAKTSSMSIINVSFNGKEDLANQEKYLATINQMYKIYIDSIVMQKEFIYTTNKNNRLQFETFLDLSKLKKGKHLLKIIGPTLDNKGLFKEEINTETLVTIPFWYFKE